MATRNLTQRYHTIRAASKTQRAVRSSSTVAEPTTLDTLGEETDGSLAIPLPAQRPDDGSGIPEWVNIHESVVKELAKVKENIRSLQKFHTIRLKVSFGEDKVAEQQLDIDRLTNEITSSLRRSEQSLKQIAVIGNNGTLTSQERTTRLNVMRSLGTELAGISKHFRHIQKDFFRNLRDQEKIGEQFFSSIDGSGTGVSLEDALNTGLTESQQQELDLIEQQSNDREREIIKIAQSVNELATLFKELNMLVIEQGTVLDRIDYNIETSLTKIKKGVVDLEGANEMSKKALSTKCLIILVIIVVLLLLVFIIKQS